ncbi:MAG: glycosyltransferase family 39 protein [Acidobacteriota bacterium]
MRPAAASSSPSDGAVVRGGALAFCARHYTRLAVLVLALAAFNLGFRLGDEVVTEWDESLYATSAAEMVQNGDWIATTFLGQLDYYNTKPPLNVWMIALSFKAFGPSLVALRLATVVSAWLTIAVLMWWTRRVWGEPVSLAAGVVLATAFGFFYVHSARNANTDAVFALLVLTTVVVVWEADTRPWVRAVVGPILAGVFLLRGMGVLMPLLFVIGYAVLGRRWGRWKPTAVAFVLFAIPVAAWVFARWQIDRWAFLERLVWYDFLARSVSSLESHRARGWFYYPYILAKHQYDWLFAAMMALLLAGVGRRAPTAGDTPPQRDGHRLAALVGCWAGATLLIPSIMQTKLAWYLNPFYPLFAIGVGWAVVRAWARMDMRSASRWRCAALAAACVIALGVAEGRLVWYSFSHRSLTLSPQGLVIAERHRLRGHRVFHRGWNRGDRFVVDAVAGAEARDVNDIAAFWRHSRQGDFLLAWERIDHPELSLVRSQQDRWLYERGAARPPSAAPGQDPADGPAGSERGPGLKNPDRRRHRPRHDRERPDGEALPGTRFDAARVRLPI